MIFLLSLHPLRAAEGPPEFPAANSAVDSVLILEDWFPNFARRHPREARAWELPMKSLLSKMPHDTLTGKLQLLMGTLYQFRHELDSAMLYFKAARKTFIPLGDTMRLAASMAGVAKMMSSQGKSAEASELIFEAISMQEQAGVTKNMAPLHLNLGQIYFRMTAFGRAKEALEKGLEWVDKNGTERFRFDILSSMASVEYERNNNELAITYLRQALDAATFQKDSILISRASNNLGVIYNFLEKKDSSRYYYEKAYQMDLGLGNPAALSISSLNLGFSLTETQDHERATALMEQSYRIMDSLRLVAELKDAYRYLAIGNANMKQYQKAYRYAMEWKFYSDSLIGLEAKTMLVDMEKKYQTEKQKREYNELEESKRREQARFFLITVILVSAAGIIVSVLLALLFYQRKRKAEQQRKALEMEHRLLRARMNPHFLFNSLNSVRKFHLQKEFDKADHYLSGFSQILRGILDHSSQTFISLEEELEMLEKYVGLEKTRFGDRFSFTIQVDPAVEPEFLNMPPLTLQPFVENAIWHGIMPLDRPGKIEIEITELNEHQLRCMIRDNGIGYHTSQARRGKEGHISRGLAIARDRLGKNGNVSIQELVLPDGAVAGTEVVLIIPVQYE